MKTAVVLLSGGLDSATVLAIAISEGFSPVALTFRYGQRHIAEIDAARRVAAVFGVDDHLIADIDLRMFGGSALTSNVPVPKGRSDDEISEGIPSTYVPARNTIFLSFAIALAEARGSFDVFIGVNSMDYSGYPDCRPAFIESFEAMANLATKSGVEGNRFRIHAPLMYLTKAQIIARGTVLGVDYGLTMTCYDPSKSGESCGRCDSCLLRLRGFKEAGLMDPIKYQERK